MNSATNGSGRSDRSYLMSAYNFARAYGKKSGQWDAGRVNRAWGYLMDQRLWEKSEEYASSASECECYDARISFNTCKHMIAHMILEKARRLQAEDQANV